MGILFGILSMLGYGLGSAMAQVPSKKIGSIKTIFYRNLFISFLLLIALVFFLDESSFSIKYIFINFLIALIGYVALSTFYEGMKKGKVGIISPIANSSVIFTIFLSIIFFKEKLSPIQVTAVILIIMGVVSTSLDLKDFRSSQLFKKSSGILYAFVACIFWGVATFLFKIPVNVLGPVLAGLVLEFGVMLYSGIHIYFSKAKFSLPSKKMLVYLFVIGFFGAMGTLFFNLGVRNCNVSIIASLASANTLISTIYAKVVYKEKLLLQQYLSVILIVLGIVLISL